MTDELSPGFLLLIGHVPNRRAPPPLRAGPPEPDYAAEARGDRKKTGRPRKPRLQPPRVDPELAREEGAKLAARGTIQVIASERVIAENLARLRAINAARLGAS